MFRVSKCLQEEKTLIPGGLLQIFHQFTKLCLMKDDQQPGLCLLQAVVEDLIGRYQQWPQVIRNSQWLCRQVVADVVIKKRLCAQK